MTEENQIVKQEDSTNLELEKYKVDKKTEIMNQKLEQGNNLMVGDMNLSQISLLADKFSKAGDLVPREYQNKPEKCFVAIYKGASLGLDAFTSLAQIAVVNNRATIWGDTALALVRNSGKLTKFKEELIKDDNGKLIAKCTVRRLDEDEQTEEYSQEDAVLAGLWGRNTWAKHPKRMLKYRARAFALRDIFPDILQGLHLKEEMEDEQPIKNTPSNTSQQKDVTNSNLTDLLNEANDE